MQAECFVIKYLSVNNCFLYLPDLWLRKLSSKPNVVKLTYKDKDYYLSWFLLPSPDSFPRLSATFARSLAIKEGDEVFISCSSEPPSLTNIVVIPKSAQDQEILELQCNRIQSTLLDQISIVAKNQPIVVWVSKQLHVTVVVDSLEPNFRYGKLNEHSEVHVKDVIVKSDTMPNAKSRTTHDPNIGRGIWSIFKHLPSILTGKNDASSSDISSVETEFKFDEYIDMGPPPVFRVHEILKIEETLQANASEVSLQCPYNVFVRKRHLPEYFDPTKDNLYKIRKILENRDFVETKSTYFLKKTDHVGPRESTELIVQLLCLEDYLDQCSSLIDKEYFAADSKHKCIYLSSNLKMNLRVKVGGKVTLKHFHSFKTSISSVEVFPYSESVTSEVFENYVKKCSKYEGVLINSYARIFFNSGESCIVKISPECEYAFFDADCLKNSRIHVNDVIQSVGGQNLEDVVDIESCLKDIEIRIFDSILSECKLTLKLSLDLHNIDDLNLERENILICGGSGSGKTTICKVLANELRKPPYFVHTHIIECIPLKGKKVDVIQKVIQSAVNDCVYHQYSVLFLDDLESITNVSTNDEETTPDSLNADRITDMIYSILTNYQTVHYICMIATCASMNKLGKKLKAPRGVHFFRSVLSTPILEKKDRIDILQLNLRNKLSLSYEINWDHYGNKTEGWMIQDLVNMAEKAAFTAWKRHVNQRLKSTLTLLDKDLSNTVNIYEPIALKGINLYKGPGHSWSDIGGLVEVKRCLIEILHWPIMYPQIFKNAPIKLQSGVLLYGMPGTGKTMLAGAIAKECGLNMISVKGPELLSKYIGASEESVRNVFEKAERAKPCVIFFDEFDSLAPRRGHDSTGVTDRVVNQLLTQLDGIEGREGVAIVAASSRPDLLDPALLRPGRLDKLLLCPLPDQAEREEILKSLCNSQRINTENLDLKELASLSTGFTGADLKAVISQARLTALEEALKTASQEERKSIDGRNLTQKLLMDSLASTKPSLSLKEKNKYNFSYSRFSKGSGFTGETLEKQKATLA